REATAHLAWIALLDRDLLTVRGGRIESRGRRDDHERETVVPSKNGERGRADLVRGVAVRGDVVGAGHAAVDLAARHQRRGRAVHDHRVRDPELLELPGGEPRTLEKRARLVDSDVRDEPGFVCGPDRTDGGSVATRREAAGVAVRQDARADRE